jgi:5-methylcytosine-specific restriction endonuclease McrA
LKRKPIRLKGRELSALNARIYERDQHRCVVCTRWVEDGHKFHHVIYKSHGGDDSYENGVLLCDDCHYEVHHGKRSVEVKDKIKRYLEWMLDELPNNEDK